MLLGWAIAFLMVIRYLPPSLLLSLFSYVASAAGFLIGMLGLLFARRSGRER
ncbi:hypothetical protein [Thermoflexus sp.]|uniref:hypothetical protein n=1 Tax=Thermoflexus sp. TaxID=1969742 RepID=UPI002ADE6F14|nr:hypothetical protein [Thermoflexus sp.]